MGRRIVLVRHAAVAVELDIPRQRWELSDDGRARARTLSRLPRWRRVERLFCSTEVKAHETAQIIGSPNGISVTVVEGLHEVERGPERWIADYGSAVRDWFEHPREPVHGWETAESARARVGRCINRLLVVQPDPFAVVGHGLTLALHVAALTGAEPATVWDAIGLPDLCVVDVDQRCVVRPFAGRGSATR